ncbi:hypothetical protein QWY31_11090 [Cytophagales bacterium LB-30]|uniref:Carboxypeptidase-like regulatory domain-containing protein n=1 Tax=Shiella aurantiaca TaxID=3058365 RepID=A0ABT8F6G7_9BACT|nr:hypothetical protein [Shiella aurantiaca]MDN4166050.1 hypothetical protein [Shiella aurantiaca]
MTRILRLLFFVLLFCWKSLSAQAQQVQIQGWVMNAYDSLPIEAAHVFIGEGSEGTFSDVMGYFSLPVRQSDTLYVSALGFGKQKLLVTLLAQEGALQTIVWLVPSPKWLQGVTVTPFAPVEKTYRSQLIDTDSSYKPPLISPEDAYATGAITRLANNFNSEYQQLKTLKAIREEQYAAWHVKQVLKNRLSVSFVTRHTILRAEEVADFIAYWNPNPIWLERASAYELMLKLKQMEADYIQSLRLSSPKNDMARTHSMELRQLIGE